MTGFASHLVVAPILVPLVGAALSILLPDRWSRVIAFLTVLLVSAASLVLFIAADAAASAYLLGAWPAPFGIVLVSDGLSSLMVLLTSALAIPSLLFATARWDRAGPRFHALFLLLVMGLNGAFLTGDLFNLFVFVEVLLAASYGLLLHGTGIARVMAGLHYIAINLAASSLFLVGIAMIYGVTGTLNMADLAVRLPMLDGANRVWFETGCAVLAVAFLVKAGMWPLGAWLPRAYSAASAPSAAMFAIMTKVGVYAVMRLHTLLFATGDTEAFGAIWLVAGGAATVVFATLGAFASRSMSRIAGYSLLMSSGTLLAVIGAGSSASLSGALFYLVTSTLAGSAFFLLIELINRGRGAITPSSAKAVFEDEYKDPYEEKPTEVSFLIPVGVALLSGGFLLSTVLLAGLPPLPTFVGKFAIMAGLIPSSGEASTQAWWIIGVMTVSSLATLLALTRIGIGLFWEGSIASPAARRAEALPIVTLLGACIALTIFAGPAMARMEAIVAWLGDPSGYVETVLGPMEGRGAPQ
jgi:multicomponent K+:H+ antiporter subunit D